MKKAIIIVGASAVLLLSSCGLQKDNGRQIIEKDGKKITVIDNQNKNTSGEVVIDKVDKINGMRGYDWLNEENILVDMANKDFKPLSIEGQKMYPKNLYLNNLKTGEQQLLSPKRINQGFAKFSPDKKYIFYKENIEETSRSFIMNLKTGESVAVSDIDTVGITEGRWVDNENVIYSTINGTIFTANVNGEITKLLKPKEKYVHNAVKVGNTLYYISGEEKMIIYNLDNGKTTSIENNPVWIIPSPDQKQLAVVRRTGSRKMKLTVTDLNGSEKASFTEGIQVFGVSWSPDSSKTAYTVGSEDKAQGGLYIADTLTGKTTQVSVDIQFASDPITWSPSGKKILTSIAVPKDGLYEMVTYVFSLK